MNLNLYSLGNIDLEAVRHETDGMDLENAEPILKMVEQIEHLKNEVKSGATVILTL